MNSNRASTTSEAIYRLLLLAYPEDFREEYGREMKSVFRDDLRRRRGILGAAAFWVGILTDVAVTAPGEHMDTLRGDLKYAFRVMRARPGFTLLALAALALGIGACSAIFSVVDGILLRPLPYPEARRLMWIAGSNLPAGIKEESASGPDFLDWRGQNRSFVDLACYSGWQPVLTGEGAPERIPGALVSAGFFRVLGIPALLGRTFAPDDDVPGKNPVVILSHGIWQRLFGGDPRVLGKSITLNGTPYRVLGVMPATFLFPSTSVSEIWTIYDSAALAGRGRRADHLGVIGRLKKESTLSQADADLNAVAAALESRYPDTNTNWRIVVMSLRDRATGQMKPALLVLLGAVGVLLVIACTNVASLLLARGMSRQKELALRTALGASRRRIMHQLLTESIVLSVMGGALSLALAWVGVRGLVAVTPADIPRIRDVGIDGTVFAFTCLMSIMTGMFFGLVPALQLSTPDIGDALKEGTRGATQGKRTVRVRNILTIGEFALATVLLIGAGLLVRSYLGLLSVDPGFRSERLLTFRLSLPAARYPDVVSTTGFYEQVLQRMRLVPGIVDVGAASDPPFLAANYWAFKVQGRPPLAPGSNQDAESNIVTPEYFRVMGIPLVRGRPLAESDNRQRNPVVVISESMARRYWPNEEPLGERIAFDKSDKGPNWREIIGVVADTRAERLGSPPYPQFYVPYAQLPQRSMTVLVKTAGAPGSVLPDIRAAILSVDREQPLHAVQTMPEVLSASIAQQRLSTLLLAVFAFLSLLLAGIGVYGVMSYAVGQRTQEMGVRMALGARPSILLRMIMSEGLALAAVGILAGVLAALGLARLIAGLLFGIEAYDPVTFVSVAAVLAAVSLIATYVPARRATRVDAIVALKCE
jgi:putative ABC transport system permease protein